MVEPSVEHSRKPKTNANPGFFLILLDLHTYIHVDTMDVECAHIISVRNVIKAAQVLPL